MRRIEAQALVLALCCAVNAVQAQDVNHAEEAFVTGRVGLGMVRSAKYIGSSETQYWPAPLASLRFGEVGYFEYSQAGLYIWANEQKNTGIAIIASPRFGVSASDGAHLTGISRRRSSLEMGVSLDYGSEEGGVSVALLQDVTGASRGSTVRAIGQRSLELGSHFGVDAELSIDWLSARTGNYYFAVDSHETTPTRSRYRPGRGFEFDAALRFHLDFGKRSTLLFGYQATLLGHRFVDSPLVERRLNHLMYLGYGWRL